MKKLARNGEVGKVYDKMGHGYRLCVPSAKSEDASLHWFNENIPPRGKYLYKVKRSVAKSLIESDLIKSYRDQVNASWYCCVM